MPIPTHGYPDFQRVVSQSDVFLDHQTAVTINATTARILGYVGSFPYMGFYFESLGGTGSVIIQFFPDETYTSGLGIFVFDVNTLGVCGGAVPIGGPFCRVTFLLGGASLQYVWKAWTAPSEFTSAQSSPTDNVIFSELGTAIGAGVTTTRDATRTCGGEAYWSVNCTAATWQATISVVDRLGTVTYLQRVDNGQPRHSELLYLPPAPARVSIQNTSGAGASFNLALVMRPWSPGR
jgi:hypothetical protein